MLPQDITEKKDHRSWVMGYRLRLFIFFLFFMTYNLLPITYHLSFAQQKEQQPAAQQRSLEEDRLNILKADIKKEIERLEKLKKEMEGVQKALDLKIQEGLLKVAKMYEAMPPEEAARRLEKLDEDTAVIILNSLKPKTAGKILAQMESDRAASLSKKILIKGKVLQEKTSQ